MNDTNSTDTGYLSDTQSNESRTNTYYSQSNHSDYTDSCGSRKSNSDSCGRKSDSCDRKRRHSRSNSCDYKCGLKRATTAVGIWNLEYNCNNGCTTTGTMQWINQLMLNGDKTLNNFTVPDLTNNPFPYLLTPGVGVWDIVNDKKYKVHVTHVGYRSSDGSPQVYYKVRMTFKLNKKGNRLRFCGEAQSYDITDPTMCSPTTEDPICFDGCGTKVMEPEC